MRILPPHPCLCKYFNHLFCEFPYARNTKKSLILCGTDNPAAVHNDPARRGNDRRCVPCTTTRRLFVAQHNGSGCARTPPCSIIELNIFLTILVYQRRHDREIFRTDHKAAFGQSAAYAHVHRHLFRLRTGGRQHPCLRSERCAGRNALFCRRGAADTGHRTADQPAVLRHSAAGASGQTDEQRHDRSR